MEWGTKATCLTADPGLSGSAEWLIFFRDSKVLSDSCNFFFFLNSGGRDCAITDVAVTIA